MTLCAAHGLVERDIAAGDVVAVTELGTDFAETITAAMDARGAFLAPRLADVLSDVPTGPRRAVRCSSDRRSTPPLVS
jgi:hypothetical protein